MLTFLGPYTVTVGANDFALKYFFPKVFVVDEHRHAGRDIKKLGSSYVVKVHRNRIKRPPARSAGHAALYPVYEFPPPVLLRNPSAFSLNFAFRSEPVRLFHSLEVSCPHKLVPVHHLALNAGLALLM
jgi:hypothetical protein